jgi:hypothetical protein
MEFTASQLDRLFLRLRQTKEELLFDVRFGQVARYKLHRDGASILGVAHCDFVEDAWSYPTYFDNHTKIQAGQVDDRVGVWLLLDVLPNLPGMPAFDYLLTTDEEIGRSSAQEVEEDLKYNWTFQFDRRGTDFVDYDKASQKFIDLFALVTGIPHGIGSFSDICYLPNSCGSRVNIGTGYHREHSPDAWVDLVECASQVERFVEFASAYAHTQFKTRRLERRKSPGFGVKWSGIWNDSNDDILAGDPDRIAYDSPQAVQQRLNDEYNELFR